VRIIDSSGNYKYAVFRWERLGHSSLSFFVGIGGGIKKRSLLTKLTFLKNKNTFNMKRILSRKFRKLLLILTARWVYG
jgi:hypothetical protein